MCSSDLEKAALFINFGDHLDMWKLMKEKIPALQENVHSFFNQYDKLHELSEKMDGNLKSGVFAICNDDIFEAVYSTNLLMRKCDVLVTKPSELSFYPVPKLMMRHIGGHEVYGAIHAQEAGDSTFECETKESLCQMIDSLIGDPDMLRGMNTNILKNNRDGLYNGGYEVVKLAAR